MIVTNFGSLLVIIGMEKWAGQFTKLSVLKLSRLADISHGQSEKNHVFNILADIQKWELEDYISTIMDLEFNTQVDDASLPEVHAAGYVLLKF